MSLLIKCPVFDANPAHIDSIAEIICAWMSEYPDCHPLFSAASKEDAEDVAKRFSNFGKKPTLLTTEVARLQQAFFKIHRERVCVCAGRIVKEAVMLRIVADSPLVEFRQKAR